ncbi:hypothetical protein L195_g044902, partial [Trifolium pratense]
MPLLNEITHAFPKAITRFVDTPTQGLSLKLITPVALDFVSQAGMRNSTFRMSWNPFLDERKMIPMSVYDNLDVDITGIQYDSRLIPPDKFFERLLDRVQPYMHMIFFVGVTQNLHCWNSQIKFYAQSGLLNFAYHMFAEMCDQGVLSWTGLIPGSVARVNGWNGKQVQSDLTSLSSFIGWYETPLHENRLIKVQCYSPKANENIYIKVVHQIGCIKIDVSRVHSLGAKRFGAFSTTKQTSDSKMSCLLPLAKAMSLELCQYSSKKKHVLLEQQPTNTSKWIHNAKKALVDISDHEEKGDDHHNSANISSKGFGMLLNLYIGNTLCLLPFLFEVKMNNQAPVASVCAVTTPKKVSYIRLFSPILIVKKAWKNIHKVKPKCGDRAIELTKVMSARCVTVVRQFCNHIENMSQNSSQSFNTGDSRLVGMEWLSAKLNE